ncbi:MAG TPA: PTS sugar transporter subunit IIA [Gemmataceae bacterium]|nr:PTS sugar transporter subunit IIA [Gemmataceae bacterium]
MQLTVRDVAKLLNVAENAVHHWVADDHLPATSINGQFRFNCAEVLEWATERKLSIAPAAFPYSDGRGGAKPELAAALRLGGVLYDVPGGDKESVLRHIIQAMPLPDDMEREFLLQVFLSREAAGSTSVGEGIALPHPRYPNVVQIEEPFITLAFLKQPIAYAAADQQPVHTLFALVSPTVRSHLGLLTVLAAALRDLEFRGAVAARRSAQEIIERAASVEAKFRLSPVGVRQ